MENKEEKLNLLVMGCPKCDFTINCDTTRPLRNRTLYCVCGKTLERMEPTAAEIWEYKEYCKVIEEERK